MRKTSAKVLGVMVLAAALAACGGMRRTEPPPPPAAVTSVQEGDRSVTETSAVTLTARVVEIDQKTRMTTLLLPDGERVTFRVDERVRNLPQVKKGDDVTVTLYESLMLTLRKPGEAMPGVEGASGGARAEPGEKPAGMRANQVKVTARVTAVDLKQRTLSLEGIDGRKVKVKARDPKRLERVKVGDLVEAVYTEAVAIAVETPAKR